MDKMPRARARKSLKFDKIIGAGQHPGGFTAQTANGTAKSGNCSGWNKDYPGPAWPEVAADGVWAHANRSGE